MPTQTGRPSNGNPTTRKKGKGARKAAASAAPLAVPPIPADVEKKPEALMKIACKLSMFNGNFVDTKFYAYSRRSPAGIVYEPQAVFANSFILRAKAPQYFEPLLRGGFEADSYIGPLHAHFPSDLPSETDACGYDSDSDIEDDIEAPSDFESDPALADPLDEDTKDEVGKPGRVGSPTENEDADDTVDLGPQGKIRLMRDFAYPTWSAFIFYLYTGDVTFAALKSQTQMPEPSGDKLRRDSLTAAAPRCSPKSMYRLADELGLDDLKALAKTDIEAKLSGDNILTELFSSFAAKYDTIRDMELTFACNKAKDAVKKGIFEWMQNIPANDLKRNAGVVAHLIQQLASATGSTVAPSPVVSTNYCNSCRTNRSWSCAYCGGQRSF